jgi:two-component system, chemotaxis family, CheB/CheR fusion protein
MPTKTSETPRIGRKATRSVDGKDSEQATPVSDVIQVIGLGASAGGIEALSHFFDAMPADSGCAFVVVLHLDPKHESEMAHILSARTPMSVLQIEDGLRIEANHVYVIAPDTDVKVCNGGLHVSKPAEPRGHRYPVDVLFKSLALDQRERAIAIVLSGTGSNGTEGLKQIRAEGGMSIAQSPETARFDGMPRSAISAGMADFILAPERMPARVLAFVRHGYVSAPAEIEASPNGQTNLDNVLELLRVRGGHDFRSYKHSTLRRRIHRRLGLRNIETLHEYVDELRTSPDELLTLAGDLMISVTGFFRDAYAWKALAELVIAPLVAEHKAESSIRVWAPACSTGEEAYSIAMLVTELAEAAGKRFDLKVFATDAQEANLSKAREGMFPRAAMAGFPASRLRRFFDMFEGCWQVKKELRDMIVFAPQNLLHDPPFSRLDLVSCRNFLIYLESDAQQRIIAICHFALREGGHLFLGNAETVGRHEDLFATISKKWRIYRRLGPTRHDLIDYSRPRAPVRPPLPSKPPASSGEPSGSLAKLARRALLDHYAPASVLIDRKDRVLYFHGRTRDYLEQPSGEPTSDLLEMARDGLSLKLRAAIRKASRENKSTTVSAKIRRRERNGSVAVTVTPLPASSPDGGYLLVSFAPVSPLDSAQAAGHERATENSSGERLLQEELTTIRAELLTAVERLETSNEELKASNEEAVSVNEELQSTNEELETSKEELQSFNEELNTVNSQLQHKIGELESATNDLSNLLVGSETATLFLDDKFCVKWFSPATKELFDLVSSDIGRPIAHFAQKFSDENLIRDAEAVLKNLVAIEVEVPSDTGHWYLRRTLPYRTRDNHIAGVVITFIDITTRKREEEALRRSEARLQELIEALPGAVYTTDAAGRIASFNPAVGQLWGRGPDKGATDSAPFYRPDGTPFSKDESPMALSVKEKRQIRGVEVAIERPDGIRVPFLAYTTLLHGDSGEVRGAVNMLVDITDSNRAEAAERRLASIVESSDDAIISKDLDGVITTWNRGAEVLFGYTAEEMIGQSVLMLVPPDRHDEESGIIERIRRGEHIEQYETVRRCKDGSPVWVSLTVSPLRNAQGDIVGASKIARNMTERRRADVHRKTLVDELNHRVKNTLAVVISIASQTFSDASTMKDARSAFASRLINLATAHDMLTRENWAGADLVDLAADTVKPHAGGLNRFRIKGANVWLGPSAALAMAMALHELATNAAKYGALSSKEGHVEIVWRLNGNDDDRRLNLTWTESGGPPVATPKRKGFGARMIERALAQELSGKVRVAYDASGVVCTIDAPMPYKKDVLRVATGLI